MNKNGASVLLLQAITVSIKDSESQATGLPDSTVDEIVGCL